MKKIKILALAFVITTSSLFATEIVPDIPVKEIRTQINELLPTPDFSIETDQTINIFYRFDITGRVYVMWVESNDMEVLKYVRENMHDKLVETNDDYDKVFKMELKLNKNQK